MKTDNFSTLGKVFQLMKIIHMRPLYFVAPASLSLIAALFEGVGMGLLLPIMQGFLIGDYSFVKEHSVLGEILYYLPQEISSRDRSLFVFLMGGFAVSILLRNTTRYFSMVSLYYLMYRSLHHLRKTLFGRYLSFGKLFFDQTNIGHHGTLMMQFTNKAFEPIATVHRMIHAFFSLAAYTIVMLVISWKITLLAIPLFLILHFSTLKIISGIRNLSQELAEKAKSMGKRTLEILSIIPLVKLYNNEEEEMEHYKEISNMSSIIEFRMAALRELLIPLQEIIALVGIVGLFAFILNLIIQDNTSHASSFIVYFYLILNSSTKFSALTGFRGSLAQAEGPATEILNLFSDIEKYYVSNGDISFNELKECIYLQNLSFSYPSGKNVLQDLSFRIQKGCTTAIVGPTGSGKTTIINLLLRYYDCPKGSIFVDGNDIRSLKTFDLHKQMALVSQETLLVNDTFKSNIIYGLDDVSDERIAAVLRLSRLEQLVSELPKGLDTLIGDRGVKLSGGEKQRLSIARALLKNANILILDEATSSLDSKTEHLIQEAIDDAIQDRTAIVIAHRLSTIQKANKIVVIDRGTCVEQGTIEELLKKKGLFYEMWEEQQFS